MIEQMQQASQTLNTVTANTKERIVQQGAQTEQVATAIKEIAGISVTVNDNVNQAAASAQQANEEAQHSSSTVNDTASAIIQLSKQIETANDAIKRVEQDSTNIGSILDVIRGIAEQTNLLALNAAIEHVREWSCVSWGSKTP